MGRRVDNRHKKDRMVEITAEKQSKEKKNKKIVGSLRDLWDNIKHTKIRIIGVPEKDEKRI